MLSEVCSKHPNTILEISLTKTPAEYINEYSQPLPKLERINSPLRPWILINWTALDDVNTAREIINRNGVSIIGERLLNNYSTAARYLYPAKDLDIKDPYTWGWYVATKETNPEVSDKGHIFVFPERITDTYQTVFNIKQILRKELLHGVVPLILKRSGEIFSSDFRSCHSSDIERLSYESNVMLNFSLEIASQNHD